MKYWITLCGLLTALSCYAQTTKINLGQQGVNPDFGSMVHTRPVQVGSNFPPTCSTGELFFNTSVAGGQNLFGCAATNTWRQIGDAVASSGSSTGMICTAGSASSTSYTCAPPNSPATIASLQNILISFIPDVTNTNGSPSLNVGATGVKTIVHQDGSGLSAGELLQNKQYLVAYDGTNFQLLGEKLMAGPSGGLVIDRSVNPPVVDLVTSIVPTKGSANVWTGANDFSAAPFTRITTSAGVPLAADCSSSSHVGKLYQRNDAQTANASFYVCSQTAGNTFSWELVQSQGGAGSVASTSGAIVLGDFASQTSVRPSEGNTSGRAGISRVINIPYDIAYNALTFNLVTAATGAGGLVLGIYSMDRGTAVCQSEAAYAGAGGTKDTSTTGVKKLGFASGSGVAGGICTLVKGSYLSLISAEEYGMQLSGYYQSDAVMGMLRSISPAYGGLISNQIGTGTGASYGVPLANYSGATFSSSVSYFPAMAIGR